MSLRWRMAIQLALAVAIITLGATRQYLFMWLPVVPYLWMTLAPAHLWPYKHVPRHRAGNSPSTPKGSAA